MKFKRLIRGGIREYRRRGVSSILPLIVWYTSREVAPNLRSKYYTEVYERDLDRYDVPIDPYRLIRVTPDDIEYKTNRERPTWASFASNLGSVKGGNWDKSSKNEFSPRHESFKAHFKDGIAWEDTPIYKEAVERISRGEYTMRMSTTEEGVLQRCYEIDELYEKIKAEGYKSQKELGIYDTKLHQLGNEIQVDIARDGSLLFVEGRHRLSIAKILNISSVPVIVVCRHKEWIHKLEDHYNRGDRLHHPDWNNIEMERGCTHAIC